MKNTLLSILCFISFASLQAQDAYLFDRDWYLHELNINDTAIDVPLLPTNPPTDCIVGITFGDFDTGETEYMISLGICSMDEAYLETIDEDSFTVHSLGGLAGAGPCYTGNTESSCAPVPVGSGVLSDFEQIHIGFYNIEDITFTYTIETTTIEGEEVTTLEVQKPNGDYAIYGETPPLSVTLNTLNNVTIYPNPATNFLTVQLDNQHIKTLVIHTLKGDRIDVSHQSNTIDVSNLSKGMYFLSLTTINGQKAVKKFIKK